MRVFLLCGTILAAIMVAEGAMTCYGDADKCAEHECCVQIGTTIFGVCKSRLDEDETCEIKPAKHLMRQHVYLFKCPCNKGLKCMDTKGGLLGKVLGKCLADSGEQTDEPKTKTTTSKPTESETEPIETEPDAVE